jgi:hypothetical protein
MSVGVGVQPITDHDLAFIGNVESHPGDELQIIHRLLLRTVLPMPITNFESGLELSVRAILESPTIEELAERIEQDLAEGITFVMPQGDFNQVIPLNSREKGPA